MLQSSTRSCVELYPERSDNGGTGYRAFLVFTIVCVSVRAAIELSILALVLVGCARNQIVGRRVLLKTSIFLPLLLGRMTSGKRMRNSFLSELVFPTEMQRSDYDLELLVSGVLSTVPVLLVNLYHLSEVTQTGLSNADWLSVLVGSWTLIKLVGMSVWARCRASSPVDSEADKTIIRHGAVEFELASSFSSSAEALGGTLDTPYSPLPPDEHDSL